MHIGIDCAVRGLEGEEEVGHEQSEDMLRGMLCFMNTCMTKASVTSMEVALSVVGMKILSLDRQLMTTKMAVKPFDGGVIELCFRTYSPLHTQYLLCFHM